MIILLKSRFSLVSTYFIRADINTYSYFARDVTYMSFISVVDRPLPLKSVHVVFTKDDFVKTKARLTKQQQMSLQLY